MGGSEEDWDIPSWEQHEHPSMTRHYAIARNTSLRISGLPNSEPPGNTHARLMCRQNFMPMITGKERHQRSHLRIENLRCPLLVPRCRPDLQLPSMFRPPSIVQIKNHRHHPIHRFPMSIKVRLIESTRLINREVAFKIKEPEKKSLVDCQTKLFQTRHVATFRSTHRCQLQPAHMISPDVLTDHLGRTPSNTRLSKIPFFPSGHAIASEFKTFRMIKKTWHTHPPSPMQALHYNRRKTRNYRAQSKTAATVESPMPNTATD